MPLVPINITGQQYQSRSGQLSNQVTQNFYAELVEDPFGKAKYVLQPTPGMTLFGSAGSGTDRGIFEHLGILYHVCGTSLYTVASDGTHTSRGTISGTDRCIFAGIGSSVVVIHNSLAHIWNGSTLTQVTDADLQAPASAAHLNNQIIYQGTGGQFGVSDAGDATSINGLNYATAESSPDDLVRVYVFDQRLYLFGDRTTETWWNSGVGNPPFDRVEGGIYQVGCGALHSVANNERAMYFLGHDLQVYRISDAGLETVSNISEHGKIAAYSTTSDAIGWCFTFEGQNFYVLTFPAEDVTWLYNEKTGWTTLSSGSAGGRSLANSYAYVFGKHIVADYNSDDLHEWSPTVYQDNFTPIVRIRDSAPIHGGLYGAPGRSVEMNDLRMIMEVGTGLGGAYVYQNTASSVAVSTPDSASISITGDIDIRGEMTIAQWTADVGALIALKGAVPAFSYGFYLTSAGELRLQLSNDGTASTTVTSSAAVGFADASLGWVRATWQASSGDVYFYTSTDGATWAQLGVMRTIALASIYDSADALQIYSQAKGDKIHSVAVYDGIAGTLAVNMDADDWGSGSTWVASTTGETWTVAAAGTMVGSAADPSITLAISDDGGNTFSSEISADIGAAADYQREVRWNALGSFQDGRILRIKATDRVFTSIHGASSHIEVGA